MGKLSRITQLLFGSSAGNNQIAQFGSLAAGSPALYPAGSVNPGIGTGGIQNLANFLQGWSAAVIGANSPALEDMNALHYLFAYQLCYLLQAGVPEWDANTVYYKGSLAQDGAGNVYVSSVDDNSGSALSNAGQWRKIKTGLNPQCTPTLAERMVSGWTSETMPDNGPWLSLIWSPEKSLFLTIGGFSNFEIAISPDGKTWTGHSASTNGTWRAVTWSPELGLFVAVNSLAINTNGVMTSPDGSTWTTRTVPSIKSWQAIVWAPDIAIFVVVSGDGAVMTSSDAITWTDRTSAASNDWRSVCWSPQLQLFVAVSSNGTDQVMTSSDGVTWTSRSASASKQWQSVCWSPELWMFVAVSFDGAIMTSYDGITWSSSAVPSTVLSFYQVIWSAETGMFVSVGANGSNSHITYSFDGVNWTDLSTGIANDAGTIGWSASLGIFVIASTSTAATSHISRYVQKFISA